MKKILILLAAICCCGCSSTGITEEEPTQNLNVKYYYKDPVIFLFTAQIEGHLYIVYDGHNSGDIIHAEHCPCKTK